MERFWWVDVPTESEGSGSLLAVLCEDSRNEVFKQAASLCQQALGLTSTAEIQLTWVDYKPDPTDSDTIKQIRNALGTSGREVACYPLAGLCFVMASFGTFRAIGLGLNKEKIKRAAWFAMFLAKVFASKTPNQEAWFDGHIRQAIKLASEARCLPSDQE